MKRFIVLLCSILLLVGCTKKQTDGVSKFVGSRDTEGFSCDLETYEDENKLFTDSELVIIGVVNNVSEVSENFNNEVLYASKINIVVKEVLKGNETIRFVSVLQMGKPDSDDYETKLKIDHEYVLFLNSKAFQGETVYDCTGIEQGIFEVDGNNKLYSYVDFGICATFDNKSINMFREKLEKNLSSNYWQALNNKL